MKIQLKYKWLFHCVIGYSNTFLLYFIYIYVLKYPPLMANAETKVEIMLTKKRL